MWKYLLAVVVASLIALIVTSYDEPLDFWVGMGFFYIMGAYIVVFAWVIEQDLKGGR